MVIDVKQVTDGLLQAIEYTRAFTAQQWTVHQGKRKDLRGYSAQLQLEIGRRVVALVDEHLPGIIADVLRDNKGILEKWARMVRDGDAK